MGTRAALRALDVDPTSDFGKGLLLGTYEMSGRFEDWLEAYRRFTPSAPLEPWYYLAVGRLDDARAALNAPAAQGAFGEYSVLAMKTLLTAMEGDVRAAEATIPSLLRQHPVKDPFYHHTAYTVGQIYALAGNAPQAVSWLREASACGYSPYGLLERDRTMNGIRGSREFNQFMAERKALLERLQREFS
jgi:hypothetical protein